MSVCAFFQNNTSTRIEGGPATGLNLHLQPPLRVASASAVVPLIRDPDLTDGPVVAALLGDHIAFDENTKSPLAEVSSAIGLILALTTRDIDNQPDGLDKHDR